MAIVGMFWNILAQWLSLLSRCLFLCKLSLESPVMSKVMSVLDERLKQPWVTQMYQECPTVSNSVRFFNMQMFSFSTCLPIYPGNCGIPGHTIWNKHNLCVFRDFFSPSLQVVLTPSPLRKAATALSASWQHSDRLHRLHRSGAAITTATAWPAGHKLDKGHISLRITSGYSQVETSWWK